MESKRIECDNLNYIEELVETRWLHRTVEILDYRHRIWTCFTECWEIQKQCKEAILYCLNKSWSNIEIK